MADELRLETFLDTKQVETAMDSLDSDVVKLGRQFQNFGNANARVRKEFVSNISSMAKELNKNLIPALNFIKEHGDKMNIDTSGIEQFIKKAEDAKGITTFLENWTTAIERLNRTTKTIGGRGVLVGIVKYQEALEKAEKQSSRVGDSVGILHELLRAFPTSGPKSLEPVLQGIRKDFQGVVSKALELNRSLGEVRESGGIDEVKALSTEYQDFEKEIVGVTTKYRTLIQVQKRMGQSMDANVQFVKRMKASLKDFPSLTGEDIRGRGTTYTDKKKQLDDQVKAYEALIVKQKQFNSVLDTEKRRKVTQEMSALRKEMRSTESALESIIQDVELMGNQVDEETASLKRMFDQFERLELPKMTERRKGGDYEREVKQINEVKKALQAQLQTLKQLRDRGQLQEFSRLLDEVDNGKIAFGGLSASIQDTVQAMERMGKNAARSEERLDELLGRIKALAKPGATSIGSQYAKEHEAVKKLGDELRQLYRQREELAESGDRAGYKRVSDEIRRLEKRVISTTTELGKLSKQFINASERAQTATGEIQELRNILRSQPTGEIYGGQNFIALKTRATEAIEVMNKIKIALQQAVSAKDIAMVDKLSKEYTQASRNAKKYVKELQDMRVAKKGLVRDLQESAAMFYLVYHAITRFVHGIQRAGASILNATVEMERLKAGLKAISGNAFLAEQRLNALVKAARQPGVSFDQMIRGTNQLRAVGLGAEFAEATLVELGNSLSRVGLPAAELDGTVRGLRQMASAGVVFQEELNQITSRIPDLNRVLVEAFGTARAVSLQKLNISVSEFLVVVLKGLQKLQRVGNTASNSIQNLNDSFFRARATIGEAFLPEIKSVIASLDNMFRSIEKMNPEIIRMIGGIATGTGATIAYIGTLAGLSFAIGKVRDGLNALRKLFITTFVTGKIGIPITLGFLALSEVLRRTLFTTKEVSSAWVRYRNEIGKSSEKSKKEIVQTKERIKRQTELVEGLEKEIKHRESLGKLPETEFLVVFRQELRDNISNTTKSLDEAVTSSSTLEKVIKDSRGLLHEYTREWKDYGKEIKRVTNAQERLGANIAKSTISQLTVEQTKLENEKIKPLRKFIELKEVELQLFREERVVQQAVLDILNKKAKVQLPLEDQSLELSTARLNINKEELKVAEQYLVILQNREKTLELQREYTARQIVEDLSKASKKIINLEKKIVFLSSNENARFYLTPKQIEQNTKKQRVELEKLRESYSSLIKEIEKADPKLFQKIFDMVPEELVAVKTELEGLEATTKRRKWIDELNTMAKGLENALSIPFDFSLIIDSFEDADADLKSVTNQNLENLRRHKEISISLGESLNDEQRAQVIERKKLIREFFGLGSIPSMQQAEQTIKSFINALRQSEYAGQIHENMSHIISDVRIFAEVLRELSKEKYVLEEMGRAMLDFAKISKQALLPENFETLSLDDQISEVKSRREATLHYYNQVRDTIREIEEAKALHDEGFEVDPKLVALFDELWKHEGFELASKADLDFLDELYERLKKIKDENDDAEKKTKSFGNKILEFYRNMEQQLGRIKKVDPQDIFGDINVTEQQLKQLGITINRTSSEIRGILRSMLDWKHGAYSELWGMTPEERAKATDLVKDDIGKLLKTLKEQDIPALEGINLNDLMDMTPEKFLDEGIKIVVQALIDRQSFEDAQKHFEDLRKQERSMKKEGRKAQFEYQRRVAEILDELRVTDDIKKVQELKKEIDKINLEAPGKIGIRQRVLEFVDFMKGVPEVVNNALSRTTYWDFYDKKIESSNSKLKSLVKTLQNFGQKAEDITTHGQLVKLLEDVGKLSNQFLGVEYRGISASQVIKNFTNRLLEMSDEIAKKEEVEEFAKEFDNINKALRKSDLAKKSTEVANIIKQLKGARIEFGHLAKEGEFLEDIYGDAIHQLLELEKRMVADESLKKATEERLKELKRYVEKFSEAITNIPFDFAGGLIGRHQKRKELEQQLVDLEQERLRAKQEIINDELLSVKERNDQLRGLEEGSAKKRLDIEQKLTEAKKGLFQDVVKSFAVSMAQIIKEELKARLKRFLINKLFDLGELALSALTGGGSSMSNLDVFNQSGDFVSSQLKGISQYKKSELAGDETFHNPQHDRMLTQLGKYQATSFRNSEASMQLGKQQAYDMVNAFKMGFEPQFKQLAGTSGGEQPPIYITVQNSMPGMDLDDLAKGIHWQQEYLLRNGEITEVRRGI